MSRFFAMTWLIAVAFLGAFSIGFADDAGTIKTIKISDEGGDSVAMKAEKIIVGEWARDVLKNYKFSVPVKTEIDLVIISVRDLGFRNGARLEEIYNKAEKIGMELCPPEIGVSLRRQYLDQPKNEWLAIGCAPIVDSEGSQGIFLVGHGGFGLWLLGYDGSLNGFWDKDFRFVFVLPHKQKLSQSNRPRN